MTSGSTQLKVLVAFRVTKVEVEAEADAARACLRFNEPVATKGDISYGAYVRTDAQARRHRHRARRHDVPRRAEARRDLSDRAAGRVPVGDRREDARAISRTNVVVPDRKPSISFAGTGYVLPREGSAGLPVTTINLDRVKVRILKVNERNLVPSIDAEKLTMSFGSDDVDEVANRTGSLVWQGEMAITGERNRPVVDRDPVEGHPQGQGAGRLSRRGRARRRQGGRGHRQPATNWVLVSNLGLTTYTGADGMAVAVRSLADAKPVPGVTLRLYAHNNAELGNGDDRRRRHRPLRRRACCAARAATSRSR